MSSPWYAAESAVEYGFRDNSCAHFVSSSTSNVGFNIRIKSAFVNADWSHVIVALMLGQVRHFKTAGQVVLITSRVPEKIARLGRTTTCDCWVVRVCR
jgi:hypothetical protein